MISIIIIPNFDLLLRIFPYLSKLKENIESNINIWEEKLKTIEHADECNKCVDKKNIR